MTEITPNSLETARLLLRPMRADDFAALHEIFTDPKVMAAFDGEVFTREQMQGWLNRNLEHQAEYGYGLFSVIRKIRWPVDRRLRAGPDDCRRSVCH